jgi:hypothetical protein
MGNKGTEKMLKLLQRFLTVEESAEPSASPKPTQE